MFRYFVRKIGMKSMHDGPSIYEVPVTERVLQYRDKNMNGDLIWADVPTVFEKDED